MTSDWAGATDEEILQWVRAPKRRNEPAPEQVVDAAMRAFQWRSVAVAVAEVEFDSATDDDELARVRVDGGDRRLRFANGTGTVDMALVGDNRRLVGTVEPVFASSAVLCHPDGATVSAPIDDEGNFFFEEVQSGPVMLRLQPSGRANAVFETEWVTI
jgi:hypothetical protein